MEPMHQPCDTLLLVMAKAKQPYQAGVYYEVQPSSQPPSIAAPTALGESGGGVRQLPGYDLHQRIGNLAGICGKASAHQARVKSCAYGEAGIPAELLGHVVPMLGSSTTTVHICFVL
ncbi:hypothetical protein HaLaN_00104 [Haematococcus lacustris]|uniref:Uncharacterized protein n=1 Tax=Haematococcus lacustris TaxID=44745 RepID=A0A699YR46_HAELA|nr:hypothetical protein HaLaN_00104 [Haematococcus lacustris]